MAGCFRNKRLICRSECFHRIIHVVFVLVGCNGDGDDELGYGFCGIPNSEFVVVVEAATVILDRGPCGRHPRENLEAIDSMVCKMMFMQ